VDEVAVTEAVRRRTSFNVIDRSSGEKADIWLLKDEPFDRGRFSRRIPIDALGLRLEVSTPEDTVLMKPKWSALAGGSAKQIDDVVGGLQFRGESPDLECLARWADALGVTCALQEARIRTAAGAP